MIVIDNFDPKAEETRNLAVDVNYISVDLQDVTYHGVYETKFGYYKGIIEDHMGVEIQPNISFFRYYTSSLRSPNYIHADLNFCDYIGVQFLHKCERGGFATWSHKETGLLEADITMPQETLDLLKKDSLDESKWRQEVLVNSRFNRCVIYNASGFHSHYPKQLWGSGPHDGRLVQVFFFNIT